MEDYKSIPALAQYIDRIGAVQLNYRRFMVKEFRGGYYTERALIKITADGSIECTKEEHAPTELEAQAITVALAAMDFPHCIEASSIVELRKKTSGELFIFISRKSGLIIMVQERRIMKSGDKLFLPWTYYSDGEWRCMEPEGALPFWKPDIQLHSRIMVHEGAKAAMFVHRLVSMGKLGDHPWWEYLSQFSHWGMIGGALAPHRTDYKELHAESPTEVVYVCDNDFPGKAALAVVSKHYGRALKGAMFDARFPVGWDLADNMPLAFTRKGRFVGPQMQEFLMPATRATELIDNPAGKGRKVAIIKRDFMEEWLHCVSPEVFVHRDWPDKIWPTSEFDNKVSPLSDADTTSRLLRKDLASKSAILKYSPALPPGIYGSDDSERYINTHKPGLIKCECGDPGPWVDFMEHLIPDPKDRLELLRWVATLIARPEIKMLYGVLLISENQGIGKGTLGEKILAPLVGIPNVSFPSENDVVDSNYNYWLAHKRLAVVHEIYAGHSVKAYNRLKSVITDHYITVSKKYQAIYQIDNWMHVFACSNSRKAIKLAEDDRRWYVPRVTDEKRGVAYWIGFNEWLRNGGLEIIKYWCGEFLKTEAAVVPGADAPYSSMKKEVLEESYSTGQTFVMQVLDRLHQKVDAGEYPGNMFVMDSDLVDLIRNQIYNGAYSDRLERPATLRRLAKERGWLVGKQRAYVKDWGLMRQGARVITLDQTIADAAPGTLCHEQMKPDEKLKPFDLSAVTSL